MAEENLEDKFPKTAEIGGFKIKYNNKRDAILYSPIIEKEIYRYKLPEQLYNSFEKKK